MTVITHPPPPTRAELVAQLARRWRIRERVAAERLDAVLDVVLAMATPKLENDWSAGEVLHVLRRWRGTMRNVTRCP